MAASPSTVARCADAIVSAAKTSSIGVLVWREGGGGGNLVFANDAAEDLLGSVRGELKSAPGRAVDSIPSLDPLRDPAPAGRIVLETPGSGADGSTRTVEVITSAVNAPLGSVRVFFLFDVSARKLAEERLAASGASFRRVLDAAPDAIVVGTRSRVLYANPALARMLGERSQNDIVRRPITDFIHADDRARAMHAVGAILETGEPLADMPLRLQRSDGSIIPVELSAMRIDWMGQRASLAAGRDVSERRRARTALAGADRLSAIGTLTAGIAHEINNPLAYVLLNLQYLLKQIARYDGSDAMTAKLIERIGEAQHGARRVGGIVADLRTLARRDEKSVGPIDIESALRASIRIAGSTFKDRARLIEHYRPAPPVEANAAKLEQVFVNLLVNAGQAIPSGKRDQNEIRVELSTEDDRVIAAIRDTGSGIAPDVLPRVFDPFFTTKPRGTGTGLGLPISYQIVSSFGGELTVESTPGRGTTFRVSLPASEEARWKEPTTPAPTPRKAAGRRVRVLVIDDEPLVTDMLQRVFGEQHDVTVTTSPSEGLSLMLQRDFDVIFCDLLMPGLSGMDLYEELARGRPGTEKRIVFMTGGAFTERAADFLARVDNRRIVKPFEISDLELALAKAAAPDE
jgi:PAS domain S-box-containing protein